MKTLKGFMENKRQKNVNFITEILKQIIINSSGKDLGINSQLWQIMITSYILQGNTLPER